MLLVGKKFVFNFLNNLLLCPKRFLRYQTLISTMHLISLVKHLKIVGILQNLEICTKFCFLHDKLLKRFLLLSPKHNQETKKILSLKLIIMVLTPSSSFCSLHHSFGLLVRLSWYIYSVLNFVPSATTLLLSAKLNDCN